MAGAARLFPASPKPAGGTVTPPVRAARVRVAKAAKDPRFMKVIAQLQSSARKVGQRDPAARKAAEAQAAAKAPPNEKEAGARANQVDDMKDAKADKPDKGGFLAVLRAEIEKVMPKNLDDADKFMKGGESGQIKGAVGSNVKQQKEGASGPTEQAAKAPPDTGKVEGKEVSALPTEAAATAPGVAGAQAMPTPRTQAEIEKPARDASASADQRMKDAELTDEQMKKANDPRFSAVLTAKGKAKETAAAGPAKFRAGEQRTLAQAKAGATGDSGRGVAALAATKGATAAKTKSRQQIAKEKDEAERKKVTDTIAAIFDRTKTKVDAKLSTLEADVMAVFDAGADAALANMKDSANQEIDRFKAKRYGGALGWTDWIADKFKDTPPEIKAIIARARQRFTTQMDALAVRVAGMVDQRLAEAKAIVGAGQAEVKRYVAGLSPSLKAVGLKAQEEVQSKFDELKQSIDDKAQDLAEKLAQKYKDASDKADAAAKEMEEANKGALKGLVDKIGEVLKMLAEFADRVVSLFKKAAGVVKKIIADPIGFLGNLLSAIKQGIAGFVGNIWTHIKKGFMSWLFGELTKTGVEIPSDLSLPSILKLVLGVLGLTWGNIRPKVVKKIGERAVTVLEKVIEILMKLFTSGPAALWEEMKAFLGNLKQMVIDAILEWVITKVITSAITKIASMFNPAGAIIQAIIMVYNVGSWLVANIGRILDFVESVVNSVDRIANGDTGGAAAFIEASLAKMIPILIGFLASLVGLGGIADKIKGFIKKVQATVGKAVDFVIDKVFNFAKKIIGKVTGKGKKDEKPDERTDAQKKADLDAAIADSESALANEDATPESVKLKLPALQKKYKLASLDLEMTNGEYDVRGVVNPEKKTRKKKLEGDNFKIEPHTATAPEKATGSGESHHVPVKVLLPYFARLLRAAAPGLKTVALRKAVAGKAAAAEATSAADGKGLSAIWISADAHKQVHSISKSVSQAEIAEVEAAKSDRMKKSDILEKEARAEARRAFGKRGVDIPKVQAGTIAIRPGVATLINFTTSEYENVAVDPAKEGTLDVEYLGRLEKIIGKVFKGSFASGIATVARAKLKPKKEWRAVLTNLANSTWKSYLKAR